MYQVTGTQQQNRSWKSSATLTSTEMYQQPRPKATKRMVSCLQSGSLAILAPVQVTYP